jgi:metal-dependent HD superfamily phosphatase/phosphodiesterase
MNEQHDLDNLESIMTDTTEVIASDRVAAPPPVNGRQGNGAVATALKPADSSIQAADLARQHIVTLRDVRNNEKARAYIEAANRQMATIGYSEHGLRHAALVAAIARNILLGLHHDQRTAELAAISGYLHDIGNCVHRIYHPQIGATMAFQLLDQMDMPAAEIATVIGAIGNHEEPEGVPINAITAAVIIADKSDVHFTRVQNPDPTTYDIHDRVNHAVQKSHILIDPAQRVITLDLIIDVTEASVMEYFEIFVVRMIMCRKAAEKLETHFRLIINGVEL